MQKKRIVEILSLTALLTLSLLGICWGPPGPPSVPVGNTEMSTLSILGIAAYGIWKMRK